eukprot:7813294-Pyramimonas_sp.AAC.1
MPIQCINQTPCLSIASSRSSCGSSMRQTSSTRWRVCFVGSESENWEAHGLPPGCGWRQVTTRMLVGPVPPQG